MLSVAVAVAFLLENKVIYIHWFWQVLLWGLAFTVAIEEYRYSRFLFLFDAAIFFILSAICSALIPLGAAALLTAAFSEFRLDRAKVPREAVLIFLSLVIWDIVLVIYVYPHIQKVITKFCIPTYENFIIGNGWSPFLGSGDFVVMGVLMLYFDMRWWQALIAYTLAILTLTYIPFGGAQLLPAIPFFVFYFVIVGYFSQLPKKEIAFPSGKGLAGLYWLTKRRQNIGGEENGEPETL
jgi:hypothetical protein